MYKNLTPANPFDGVANGKKATLTLEVGPRYHSIKLTGTVKPPTGGTATPAMIFGLCRLKVNGKTQREFTVAELDELNTLLGEQYRMRVENLTDPGTALAANDTARFTVDIFLGEPFRESYYIRDSMAWPTRWPNPADPTKPIDLKSFTLEVEIPEVTGATLHDLTAYIWTDNQLGTLDANGKPVFNLTKWSRDSISYTASGQRKLNTLPKMGILQQYSFFTQPEDPITHMYIKVDGDVKLDVSKVVNDDELVKNGLNEAGISANRFDVVFDQSDSPIDALPLNGVTTLNVWPTFESASAAETVATLITQYYGPLD